MGNIHKMHPCAVPNCPNECRIMRLMCRRHWYMVPQALRDEYWEHYDSAVVRGDKEPTVEWLTIRQQAIHAARKFERAKK